MRSIDDLDFETIKKESPFHVKEQENKYQIIVFGKSENLCKLISLYIDSAGKTIKTCIPGESISNKEHNHQKIYFWGDHIIFQTQASCDKHKKIFFQKDIKPNVYSMINTYNKIYRDKK
ncbi:MAG: hypothetical protein ACOCQQ_01715 [Candidatus Nanoarchaeia archaeon]